MTLVVSVRRSSNWAAETYRTFISATTKEDLVVLQGLIETGKITPVVDRTFPLSATAEAIAYVGKRHTQGKTVLTV